jgi:FkbM family methyltransferase
MVNKFKRLLAQLFAKFVPQAVYEQLKVNYSEKEDYSQVYFSQEGEEIVLRRFFNYSNTGFFVDIGAHHPKRFSNTFVLYKMGWRGVNIDALPGSMDIFNQIRPNDINIEAAISDKTETLLYYTFNEPALNTFDESKMLEIVKNTSYQLTAKLEIKTTTLAQVLDIHLKENQKIDFFSIDVEGLDLKVLKSNNWIKYKPKVIVIESTNSDINSLQFDEIAIFLHKLGYAPFAKTFKSTFYSC